MTDQLAALLLQYKYRNEGDVPFTVGPDEQHMAAWLRERGVTDDSLFASRDRTARLRFIDGLTDEDVDDVCHIYHNWDSDEDAEAAQQFRAALRKLAEEEQ